MATSDADPFNQAEFPALMAEMTRFLDLMTLFASPKLSRKLGDIPPREGILEHLDTYMKVAARMRAPEGCEPLPDTRAHVLKLRELFSSWTPSRDVPVDIVHAARSFLAAFGIPEPAEGWDEFEGNPLGDSSGNPSIGSPPTIL